MPIGIDLASFNKGSLYIRLFEAFFSLIFSLGIVIYQKIPATGLDWSIYPANFCSPLSLSVFIASFGLAILIFCLAEIVRYFTFKHFNKNESAFAIEYRGGLSQFSRYIARHRLQLLVLVLLVLVPWVLLWFNYFPGTSMNDQISMIADPLVSSRTHPFIHSIGISVCVRASMLLFGSGELGFAFYVFLQMVFSVFCLSCVLMWLSWHDCPKGIVVILALVFGLTPLIANYAMAALKDTIYSYAMLLWIPFMVELSLRRKNMRWRPATLLLMVGLMLLIMWTRNNGLYVAIVLGLIITLVFGNRGRIAVLLCVALTLVISQVPNKLIALKVGEHSFTETIGIPLQQIAAVAAEKPEAFTQDEVNFINSWIPFELLPTIYAPANVDLVKYNEQFNRPVLDSAKKEFMKMYISVGLRCPDIYLRAWISQTFGVWTLAPYDSLQSAFFSISDNLDVDWTRDAKQDYGLINHSLYPDSIAQTIDAFHRSTAKCFGAGTMFYIFVFVTWIGALLKRNSTAFWGFLPSFLLWGTLLIASPISGAMRYSLPVVLAIPIMIGFWFVGFSPTKSSRSGHHFA